LDLSHEGLRLAHVPLIYQLLEVDIYSESIAQASSRQAKKATCSHQTVVTPEVYALSVAMFQQSFKLARPFNQRVLKSYNYPLLLDEIHGASPNIKWTGDLSLHPIYSAVKIGKTVYKVVLLVFLILDLLLTNSAWRGCYCTSW
jgi:hypothetical protein